MVLTGAPNAPTASPSWKQNHFEFGRINSVPDPLFEDHWTCDSAATVDDLYVVNHFASQTGLGDDGYSQCANRSASAVKHANACKSHANRMPNMVAFDFYHLGAGPIAAANALNGTDISIPPRRPRL